ncbi:MAG: leucine-rich repeat protein [Oscillospiraceae bacterium]|nr:leucine-rich repeat protein [Oscillospiraceae bacterium]
MPQTMTRIGDSAFRGCKSLTAIRIPDGITKIETQVFDHCESLQEVILPDGLVSIGLTSFEGCAKLTEIVLPESVSKIGVKAFSNCTALKCVTILSRVTEIGDMAFDFCDALRIRSWRGSVAESYAKRRGIPFDALDRPGDLDGDCSVTMSDAVLMFRLLTEAPMQEGELKRTDADMDSDGVLTLRDLRIMLIALGQTA